MYESKHQPVAPKHVFFGRIFRSILLVMGVLLFCLLIGVLGYHKLAGAGWVDSLHNASMILSGMGPVIEIKTTSGKLFSSAYALFSGVVFITNIGLILAPAMHRLIHRIHADRI